MTQGLQLTARSPAARASRAILAAVAQARCGGLTEPALEWLLRTRFPASTVRGAMRRLALAGVIVATGARRKRARVWTTTR